MRSEYTKRKNLEIYQEDEEPRLEGACRRDARLISRHGGNSITKGIVEADMVCTEKRTDKSSLDDTM